MAKIHCIIPIGWSASGASSLKVVDNDVLHRECEDADMCLLQVVIVGLESENR